MARTKGSATPLADQVSVGVSDGPAVEESVRLFVGGLYCSEAILRAFNEEYALGLDPAAYTIATAFGAGIGASKCACGAVTGGVLALSLALGRTSPDESEAAAFETSAELHDRWRAEEGVLCCRVLTKDVEWGSAEHGALCTEKVRLAARLTDEILARALAAREAQ